MASITFHLDVETLKKKKKEESDTCARYRAREDQNKSEHCQSQQKKINHRIKVSRRGNGEKPEEDKEENSLSVMTLKTYKGAREKAKEEKVMKTVDIRDRFYHPWKRKERRRVHSGNSSIPQFRRRVLSYSK